MPEKVLSPKQKLFFPNLDGLRFICFLMVFLYHWNLNCALAIKNTFVKNTFNFIFQHGNVGVNIFFVLSGFLITFLLIKEKEWKADINLRNFYIRRVLRIWPLYYLIVITGMIIYPLIKYGTLHSGNDGSNLYYYLAFASNFDLIHIWPQMPDVLPVVVLWSVSVEEQFYLVWPVILKYFPIKLYKYIFLVIIAGTLVFRIFHTGHTEQEYAMRYFHTFSVIGDMAIGGLLAYYCSFQSKFLKWVTNIPRPHIIAIYVITLLVILYKKQVFYSEIPLVFERIILSSLFGFIIIEQNFSKHSFFKFSSFRLISKLGIYTYGLYCLQFVGILVVQKLLIKTRLGLGSSWINIAGCLLALCLLIIISMASYHLFEKYFLRWKDRFAVITKK